MYYCYTKHNPLRKILIYPGLGLARLSFLVEERNGGEVKKMPSLRADPEPARVRRLR